MIKHLLTLLAGLFITFLFGVFGGIALERFFLSDPLTSLPRPSSPPIEIEKETEGETPIEKSVLIDTNNLSVHYPLQIHLKWQPESAFSSSEIEKYITLSPAIEGKWQWEKHILWGGWTAEFLSNKPFPEKLTMNINAPFLKEPFQRVFEKQKTVSEKNEEMLLTCAPPKIIATVPQNGEKNIDPTLPVKITEIEFLSYLNDITTSTSTTSTSTSSTRSSTSSSSTAASTIAPTTSAPTTWTTFTTVSTTTTEDPSLLWKANTKLDRVREEINNWYKSGVPVGISTLDVPHLTSAM